MTPLGNPQEGQCAVPSVHHRRRRGPELRRRVPSAAAGRAQCRAQHRSNPRRGCSCRRCRVEPMSVGAGRRVGRRHCSAHPSARAYHCPRPPMSVTWSRSTRVLLRPQDCAVSGSTAGAGPYRQGWRRSGTLPIYLACSKQGRTARLTLRSCECFRLEMATYVLVPGAGGTPWYWHRLVPELRQRGHEMVTVNLPAADDSA